MGRASASYTLILENFLTKFGLKLLLELPVYEQLLPEGLHPYSANQSFL